MLHPYVQQCITAIQAVATHSFFMNRLLLTQDDLPGLREASQSGYMAFSGAMVYRGVCMDHQPAHHVLEILEAGQPEVEIAYEDWQDMRGTRKKER
jgi:hypothetical protein